MKALQYADLIDELLCADLSPQARAVALDGINERKLATGRLHQAVIQHIELVIAAGSSQAYAIETASVIYDFDSRWVRRLWSYRLERGPALVWASKTPLAALTEPQ